MEHVKKAAITLLLVAMVAVAQQPSSNATPPNVPKNIKNYFVMFLVHKSQQAAGGAPTEQVKQAHLAFMRQMTESRKYMLAGPFLDHGAIVGVIIAAAQSEGEAQSWESADPLVTALGLKIEVHPAMMPSLDSLKIEY